MKTAKAFAFSVFIFSLFGWIYIVINAEVHPQTLHLPLTHLLPFPREDTFGIICFIISFIAFFIWSLIKDRV